ncbi:MAG TPA: response regulator [Actinomycetota bacterium]|nr:response regulator [Actinomycetota bacterium]
MRRLLLVDKNPYDLEAMRAALSSPDVEIETADDGDDALTIALERPPDVVIAASSLGQMGGFALSRELKRFGESGRIPTPRVIVLLERRQDGWLASWSRCDAWATKPVEDGELEELVGAPTAS